MVGVIGLLASSACGRFGFDPSASGDATSSASGWLAPEWSDRKRIVISASSIAEDLSAFPVSIVIIGDASIRAHIGPTGDDLRFTLGDGETLVPFDVEEFDQATGTLSAWVTPPALSASTNTTLYVYYGNAVASSAEDPAATFSNAYHAVWHMAEIPTVTPNAYDTTTYSHVGTFNGGMPATASVPGVVGRALDFDGVDDYVSTPDSPSLRFADQPFSIDAWVFMRNASAFKIYAKGLTRPGIEYYFRTGQEADDDLIIRSYDAGGDYIGRLYSAGMTPYTNVWTHVAATYDGSRTNAGFALYVDGNRVDDQDAALNVYDGALSAGAAVDIGRYQGGGFANGTIDELRLSSVVRSPGWFLTTVRNIDQRSAFYTVSPEESR